MTVKDRRFLGERQYQKILQWAQEIDVCFVITKLKATTI